MKTLVIFWFGMLLICQSFAQEGRFFRVVAPVATAITSIASDGTLTWTNAQTNITCTIQTAQTLSGESNWVDYVQVPISNLVTTLRLFDPSPPLDMAFIPAGSFTMGDSFAEGDTSELPAHTVYVSAFYIDRKEVTKAMWDAVYSWASAHGYSFDYVGLAKAANHPVESINWYDAVKWCNARSEKEGRVPAYYISAAQATVYRSGILNLTNACVNWTANGYRLPTEAEWEKAARGGASAQRFPWGNTIAHSQANYYSSTNYTYNISPTGGYHPSYNDGVFPFTSPVGSFAANGYDLYDMAGNVWEWCWDWYDEKYYSTSPGIDPRGPASVILFPVRRLRGGSWSFPANTARCSIRYDYCPSCVSLRVGFRCVRGL